MSSSESEEDITKTIRERDPLCLFCYPCESLCDNENDNYIKDDKITNVTSSKANRRKWPARKEKQEIWLRRRNEVRRKQRIMDTGRHLKSFLLTSVKPGRDQQKVYIPCLIEALETIKDAWPSNKGFSTEGFMDRKDTSERVRATDKMIEEKHVIPSFSSRRSSMPEDVMRKYFLKKFIPSEDSETIHTDQEATSSASKDSPKNEDSKLSENFEHASSRKLTEHYSEGALNKLGLSTGVKRVTQNDYDKQGRGIIIQKTKERGSQTGRFSSDASPTAKEEETEETRTSESLPSSSPVELPRNPSSSGNLSSESEDVKCTCAELTSSKDTSTDLFRSANSTLSQTVSEKSVSTQDSTVSVHSISTGGDSTTSNSNSNSTSPAYPQKTRIKGITSGLFSRISKADRKFQRQYLKPPRRRFFCRKHCRRRIKKSHYDISEDKGSCSVKCEPPNQDNNEDSNRCIKYTAEEVYMMQQMRHRKFIENFGRFSMPVPDTTDADSVRACASSGSAYKQIEDLDDRVLIPRYSALPRTLSMLVNTSSGDTSAINSDSDTLSLADSLEDYPVVHVHHFDTKKERKPVRGEVNLIQESKLKIKRRHPRPKAFFVSFKEPFGEDELLSGITKIPEPPDKIKARINERQLNIIRLRKQNLEKRLECKEKRKQKRLAKDARGLRHRKNCSKNDGMAAHKEESSIIRKEGKHPFYLQKKKSVQEKTIPNTTSTSTSPERDTQVHRKKKLRKDKSITSTARHSSTVETVSKNNVGDLRRVDNALLNGNVPKPQAVIYPSQMPASEPDLYRKIKQLSTVQPRPGKYRQRFEVIPEEKSSSLSSTDERKPDEQKGRATGHKSISGNAPNVIFAKLAGSSLQPPVKDHPIILVSPKSGSSSTSSRRGRDALIAMNRDDFNRLSKGWMNFYMLKDVSDGSENGVPEDDRKKSHLSDRRAGFKQKTKSVDASPVDPDVKFSEFTVTEKQERDLKGERKDFGKEEVKKSLNEELRFHSSNTILKPISVTPKSSEKRLSLPELITPSVNNTCGDQQTKNKNCDLILPKVMDKFVDSDGMDSDSTVYCQLPSVIVPRLAFNESDDSPSADSMSNSESEERQCKTSSFQNNKYLPLRKRTASTRNRKREIHHESSKHSNDCPEWSVTVAGTLDLTTPDLEMRLSFPANGTVPPQATQSDSGFVEDSRSHHVTDDNVKQKWTVTVKNPRPGDMDGMKRKMDKNQALPNLGHTQLLNMKKSVKSLSLRNGTKEVDAEGKILIYWPRIELTRNELVEEGVNEEELSVRGNAVPIEKKPKPPTMTERDLTRGLTSRSTQMDNKSIYRSTRD